MQENLQAAAIIQKNKTFDANGILRFLNILICFATIFYFLFFGENIYVDYLTLFLSILLSLQTHVALIMENKNRDIFVLIYAYVMTFYFSLRILTLNIFSFSHTFDRFPYDASDSNFALYYILIANLFLYSGFMSIKVNTKLSNSELPNQKFSIFIVMFILLITLANSGTTNSIQILSLISNFFDPRVVMIVSLVFLIIYSSKINIFLFWFIVIFILSQIIIVTLGGSRSGILSVVELSLIILLVIRNNIQISKKKTYLIMFLTPLFLSILIFSYVFATITRMNSGEDGINIEKTIIIKEVFDNLSGEKLEFMLGHIAGRIAFFDFSSELIAHSDKYKDLFTLSTYSQSIIDNILTPGFDLYDQSRISYSLTFVYNNFGNPKKSLVSEYYQSDQFGIHGEMYLLFGFGSVFLFYFIGFVFKFIYTNIRSSNLFILTINKVFVVLIFFIFIKSFGIDWLLYDIIVLFIALHISAFFFRIKINLRK